MTPVGNLACEVNASKRPTAHTLPAPTECTRFISSSLAKTLSPPSLRSIDRLTAPDCPTATSPGSIKATDTLSEEWVGGAGCADWEGSEGEEE